MDYENSGSDYESSSGTVWNMSGDYNQALQLEQNKQICPEQWAFLMKDKVKPKVQLNMDDLYQEKSNQEILQIFKCIFCHGIPINPHECINCEVVFCYDCMKTNERIADYRASRKCPQCREPFKTKKINKNLNAITTEKLRFQHRCISEEEEQELRKREGQAGGQPTKELTAFEKFKLTPAYRQILISQGKALPEGDVASADQKDGDKLQGEKNEDGKDQICEVTGKEKQLPEMKIMSYKEYLRHLREDNCAKFKIYTCPLNCELGQTKMSYKEYVHHIKHDCPNVLIQCTRCNEKSLRSKKGRNKHQTRTCINFLSKTIKKQKQDFLDMKNKRRKLLKSYIERKSILDSVRD